MAYLGKTPSQAVRSRYYFTATGGETSLSGADDNANTLTFTDGNYVDVALNGVTLVAGTDYNTTTANTIGGLTALVASDVIEVIVYDTFSVFSGNVNGDFTVGGNMTVTGTVDGRDVAADGTKLDGIEALADVTDTANVTAAGAAMLTGANFTGNVDVTGEVTATGYFRIPNNQQGGFFDVAGNNGITLVGSTGSPASTIIAYTGGSERLRIDTSGNVGIGVTPFANNIGNGLDIASGAGMFGSSNSNYLTGNLYYSSGWKYKASASGSMALLDGAGSIKFFNAPAGSANGSATLTERLRIDSSGNLLVGTTTNGTTADGTVIRASAETLMTRSNGAPLLLNRRGTDGAVIEVRNDNSAVGYITANASGMGVYLGGTGSANHLDDYEEGTWTPEFQATITNFSSITYNSNQHKAYYVKVGNIVHITLYTRVDAFSGGSGSLRIAGLPFNMGGTGSSAGGAAGYIQNWNSTFSIHGATLATDQIYLNKNGNNTTPVTVSDMRNSNDSNQMSMSFSYRTA